MERMKAGMKVLAATRTGPRLGWMVRRLARRLGWIGLAGAGGALLIAGTAWQAHTVKLRQQQLQGQIAQARAVSERSAPADDEPAALARQIAAFYAHLPEHAQIPDQLNELVRAAERHHVALDKGDYKAHAEERAAFLRYQITLPVKAAYAGVQAFIVQALHDLPALTLESISFKRERFDAAEVEASIHFVLLVKAPHPEAVR